MNTALITQLWHIHRQCKALLSFNINDIVLYYHSNTNQHASSSPKANNLSQHSDHKKPEHLNDYGLRQKVGLLLGPLLFLIMLVISTPAGMTPAAQKMAAITLLMVTWWSCESIPIPVTSLLPLALFPIFGLMDVRHVSAPYANHIVFLFMGGFIIALSMQRWNLHKRLAMNVIKAIGFSTGRLIFGFMLATAGLSAFISNTATTLMLMPIGLAIIDHTIKEGEKTELKHTVDFRHGHFAFGINLMLGIAYAASIGGIATLIGTPPNAVFAAYLSAYYGFEISFADWLAIGIPLVVILLPLCWLWLTRVANPMILTQVPGGRELIEAELQKLGKMHAGERWTVLVFCLTALGWIFRRKISLLFPDPTFISDATIAMFGAILLFIIPINLKRNLFVMNWEWAIKLPWGILILFGGGLALASGFKVTHLADWIGLQVDLLTWAPMFVIVAVTALVVIFLTEVTSNIATISMILPIYSALAIGMHQNPLLLLIPATMTASCAFMLPIATPPNAVIFSSGYVLISQMIKSGFGLNLIAVMIIVLLTYFWGVPVFDIIFHQLPSWA